MDRLLTLYSYHLQHEISDQCTVYILNQHILCIMSSSNGHTISGPSNISGTGNTKRRRTGNHWIFPLTPSAAVPALISYAESLAQQYRDRSTRAFSKLPNHKRPKSGLSFNVIYSRDPLNEHQEEKKKKYLEVCVQCFKYLLSKHAALNPA